MSKAKCLSCNKFFSKITHTNRFCSEECLKSSGRSSSVYESVGKKITEKVKPKRWDIKKECAFCKSKFIAVNKCNKYCSNECRKEIEKISTGRYVLNPNETLTGGTVGVMSELLVAIELLKIGYVVFRQIGLSNFCDLVAFKNGKTLFIEARTGYVGTSGKITLPSKIHPMATHFGVYLRNEDRVIFLNKQKIPVDISK